MSRWDLLDGPVVEGDPAGVRLLAAASDRASEAAADARHGLQTVGGDIAGSIWSGAMADRFAEVFSPIAPDLGHMAESYDRVSAALRDYATELERIQVAARQALARAELAQARRDAAGPALAAAQDRVRSLTRQLNDVGADLSSKTQQRAVTDPNDVATIALLDDAIARARENQHRVSGALNTATSEVRAHQRDLDEADRALGQERTVAGSLRADHLAAERQAAERIRDAVHWRLRNKSMFDKAAGWTREQLDAARDLLRDPAGALQAGFFKAQEILERISAVLDRITKVLMPVLAVLAVVAAVVLVVKAPFLIPLALAFAGKAVGVAWKTKTLVDLAKIAMDAGILVTGRSTGTTVNPRTGRKVTPGGIIQDSARLGIKLGTGKIGKTLGGSTKRVVGPHSLFRTHTDKVRRQGTEKVRRQAADEARRQGTDKVRRQTTDEARRQGTDEARRQGTDEARRQTADKARHQAADKAVQEGTGTLVEGGVSDGLFAVAEPVGTKVQQGTSLFHSGLAQPVSGPCFVPSTTGGGW
jgi:uncharacterized protein YukE